MIRKVITILLFIIVINILIMFNQENRATQVFSEKDEQKIVNYEIYSLNIEDLNVTTKNLTNYFYGDEIKILGITPKVNDLYLNKLESQTRYYSFENKRINQNLKEVEEAFKALLKKYGFNGEIDKIDFNGVKISKIKIYTTNQNIQKLISDYPKIKK